MKRPSSQRGSAIIMLFIAVALFGALAFAFTQGTRTSTSMMAGEQAKTYAQEIIAYGNDVRTAVKRMQLRGIKDKEFSFENSVFTTNGGTQMIPAARNPNCTTDACKVFHSSGGGMVAKKTPAGSAKNIETPGNPTSGQDGTWQSYETSMDGVGSSANDIVLIANFITKEVCIKINDILGVTNPGGNPPAITYTGAEVTVQDGSLDATGTFSGGAITGLSSYCYQIASRPLVHNFVTTVLAR